MNLNALAEAIGLEEEEYRELLELLMETGRADHDQLQTALQAGDAETVAHKAHTICGAAGNLGILDMYEAAKRIEQAAMDQRLDAVSSDVQTVSELFDAIAGCLER